MLPANNCCYGIDVGFPMLLAAIVHIGCSPLLIAAVDLVTVKVSLWLVVVTS